MRTDFFGVWLIRTWVIDAVHNTQGAEPWEAWPPTSDVLPVMTIQPGIPGPEPLIGESPKVSGDCNGVEKQDSRAKLGGTKQNVTLRFCRVCHVGGGAATQLVSCSPSRPQGVLPAGTQRKGALFPHSHSAPMDWWCLR